MKELLKFRANCLVVCVWHQRGAFQPKLARMSVDRMSYFALVIALAV